MEAIDHRAAAMVAGKVAKTDGEDQVSEVTDDQIKQILELTAFNQDDKGEPDDEWWGHDTVVGTTKSLGDQIRAIIGEDIRDVLLSDEFMEKFAEKFANANTPLPTTIDIVSTPHAAPSFSREVGRS